jgi:hypothetical protein
MRISLKELFIHRQYMDGPVYYYFDRKTYTVCDREHMEDEQDLPYVRYIPLFQVDEQALQKAYIQQYMPKGTWRKLQESPLCFGAFIEINHKERAWWDFYMKVVYDQAKQWCMENHIVFEDDEI